MNIVVKFDSTPPSLFTSLSLSLSLSLIPSSRCKRREPSQNCVIFSDESEMPQTLESLCSQPVCGLHNYDIITLVHKFTCYSKHNTMYRCTHTHVYMHFSLLLHTLHIDHLIDYILPMKSLPRAYSGAPGQILLAVDLVCVNH